MSRHGLSSHIVPTTFFVVVMAIAAGLGACQKPQAGADSSPAKQGVTVPPSDKNTGDTQHTDQSGSGQKSP